MTSYVFFKIKDFLNLEQGWCYGESKTFTEKDTGIAEQIATHLLSSGFNNLDAFPGLNGEIRVTAYFKTHYLEFTLESGNNITFLHENSNEELEYQENINLENCFKKIKELGSLCNSYVLSTKDISTKNSKDSKVLHSDHLQTVVSLFFVKNVPWKSVDKFASTSKIITLISAGNPPYSGYSASTFCQ